MQQARGVIEQNFLQGWFRNFGFQNIVEKIDDERPRRREADIGAKRYSARAGHLNEIRQVTGFGAAKATFKFGKSRKSCPAG